MSILAVSIRFFWEIQVAWRQYCLIIFVMIAFDSFFLHSTGTYCQPENHWSQILVFATLQPNNYWSKQIIGITKPGDFTFATIQWPRQKCLNMWSDAQYYLSHKIIWLLQPVLLALVFIIYEKPKVWVDRSISWSSIPKLNLNEKLGM